MSEISTVFELPDSIERDTLSFRQKVKDFLDGQTRPEVFKAYRIPRGIYEQRQTGAFMVRVRVPAGMILPEQLRRLAELSRTYGNGILHVTTRQDIQIHAVAIEKTPDILESLLEVGLSSRGGGGNTVRNISACPRAGVCLNETFDVRPYAIALSEYLLGSDSSFNLPRKFKVAFSGCSQDCALASVNDLGFFAHLKDAAKGFSAYAAGGMGSNPCVAIKLEDFIPAEEVFYVAEAMKRLFDQHGDRTNRHRARLRYVLNRLGESEFVRLYKELLATVRSEKLHLPDVREIRSESKIGKLSDAERKHETSDGYEKWLSQSVLPEKQSGEFSVRIRLALGDISAEDMEAIVALARVVGEGYIRTSQLQDLFLCCVQKTDLPFIFAELSKLKADVLTASGPKLVACAGASTCRLGFCRSRGLATAIADKLRQTDLSIESDSEAIRISGCHNSCGHHLIGTIGLQGRAKRVGGKLVPCYTVLVGGKAAEAEASLAEQVGIVPAKNVPALVSDVLGLAQSLGKVDKEQIAKIAAKYSHIPTIEQQPEMYRDFGCVSDFSLAGRGPGECGAGVMDVVQLDIDQAKQSLDKARATADGKERSDAIYAALVATARSLLITRGLEPKKDREVFTAFGEHLIDPGWVAQETKQLLDQALDYRLGDTDDISNLQESAERMLGRVEELFRSLDASLNFRVEPISKGPSDEKSLKDSEHLIDLRGIKCPLNFVKAKLELEKIAVGQVLEVLLDPGEPVANVPASFTEQGQEILEVIESDGHFRLKVRKTS